MVILPGAARPSGSNGRAERQRERESISLWSEYRYTMIYINASIVQDSEISSLNLHDRPEARESPLQGSLLGRLGDIHDPGGSGLEGLRLRASGSSLPFRISGGFYQLGLLSVVTLGV